MADWKETLEPYIKVQESVKTVSLNPTAGEDLIIGVTLVSDAGSYTPTLISGQKEFREFLASGEITEDYINSLDDLYEGASQMWANAYRLAGSTSLLVVRAGKGDGVYYAKPLSSEGNNSNYILKGSEILKKLSGGFKLAINETTDDADTYTDGWSIAVTGVGVYGNRVTLDGVMVDYVCNSLVDLVDALNSTDKFLATKYSFYSDKACTVLVSDVSSESVKRSIKGVKFEDVYIANDFLDCTDGLEEIESGKPTTAFIRKKDTGEDEVVNYGTRFLILCTIEATVNQRDLTESFVTAYQDDSVPEWYAVNKYNSKSDLAVRIRRFNHTAVVDKEIAEQTKLTAGGESPYDVLPSVLDTLTKKGLSSSNTDMMKAYDFYEVAVKDPIMSDNVLFFNIGNVTAKGDMTIDEVNDSLSMIYLQLPSDLSELGLNYYDYSSDDKVAVKVDPSDSIYSQYQEQSDLVNEKEEGSAERAAAESVLSSIAASAESGNLAEVLISAEVGRYVCDSDTSSGNYSFTMYKIVTNNADSIYLNLGIDDATKSLIQVSTTDLMNSLDLIENDEVYTVEGLCDLGNTDKMFQNYMRNMAINSNYFYPNSTINSTNYLTIANGVSKISQDSSKLYCSAPWDIDTGTLGWKFYACPSVIYWESVSKNRKNNEEFRSLFGQLSIGYQSPVVEFNKKTRQLLLTKKVNTVMWDTQTQAWNMNDNYTKQSEDNIMSDESNVRLGIRISKAIPTLLKQFIGKKISEKLCKNVEDVLKYWLNSSIMSLPYGPEAYQVSCKYDAALARKNKIKVVVAVRFYRALKFIDVYNNYYDTGMDFSEE